MTYKRGVNYKAICVVVKKEEHKNYKEAAKLKGWTMAEWIRRTLSSQAIHELSYTRNDTCPVDPTI